MKKNLAGALLLGLITCFSGCTKDEYNDSVIVFAPDSLLLNGNGEIRELRFLSPEGHESALRVNQDWLNVSAEKTGSTTRYCLTAAYNDAGTTRQAVLTIGYQGREKNVPVAQAAGQARAPFLTVDQPSNTFANVGGYASLRILSNEAWRIRLDPEAPWLSLAEAKDSTGVSSAVVNLLASPNEEVGTNRQATLSVSLVSHPEMVKTVTLSQNAFAESFSLSSEEISLNKAAGSHATLIVQSTAHWRLEGLPQWLQANRTEASGFMTKDSIMLTAAEENPDNDPRQAVLSIKAGDVVMGTVTVTQRGDNITAFKLSESNVRVSSIQNGDGSVANLFDDDPSTYFTTYWNSYDVTVPQWITVDLGDEAVQQLYFQYQTRNRLDYVPTKVLLQVTDDAPTAHIWKKEGDAFTDADRNWKTVATYEGDKWCPVKAGAVSGKLTGKADKKYRYWRFYVEKARQNPKYEAGYPNAFCFQLSELKLYLYH